MGKKDNQTVKAHFIDVAKEMRIWETETGRWQCDIKMRNGEYGVGQADDPDTAFNKAVNDTIKRIW
jgi:hypothetical protein